MIGTKLGHYEITGHLGTGGMGEVFQATDSKLGRSVAIKLLPEAFTHDKERVARFEREARLLASLNHSNIASIYGVEDSGGRKFLVMELVPGETLAERIKRGPMPLDEALKIAVQIAEALEVAHEKGVMHRDLKPANIKVTPNGQVKVLDFGLAKAFSGEATVVDWSNSPTISMSAAAATNVGVILGTAAYMSPEQARGQDVDHRTDIFAFGCVLYEMLTGRQTFPGEGASDILASVLKSEPDWNRLPSDTPAPVRRVLRRCLRKDRNRRVQTIGDARIEIEEAGAEPEQTGLAAAPPAPRRRDVLKWIAAGGAAVAAGDVLERLYFRKSAEASEMRVLPINMPPTSDPMSFALSPDGRSLVFVASGDKQSQLWLRRLDTGDERPLKGTEGASFPFWKPNNQSVAFVADGNLRRIDIDSGAAPQTLVANLMLNRGGAWGPEGVILYTPNGGTPLYRVSDSGGNVRAVTKLYPSHTSHRFPFFLPDGKQFLFYAWGGADIQGIYLGSLEDSSKAQLVLTSESAGAYLPGGWLVFVLSETLVAQRFDPVTGKLSGEPQKVGGPVGSDGSFGLGAFSVSPAGLIAYRAKIAGGRQLIWFGKNEKPLGTFGSRDENGMLDPTISPNGRRVAVDRSLHGNQDVWTLDPTPQVFASGKNNESLPVWSASGKWIVFRSNRKSAFDLYVKSIENGEEKLLYESPELKIANDWYKSSLLFYRVNSDTQVRSLWVLSVTEDGNRNGDPQAFQNHDWDELNGQFSPNGQFVAYESKESQSREIYVASFSKKLRPTKVSEGGGIWPKWSPDGNELYYLGPRGMLMSVSLTVKGDEVEPGPRTELFHPPIVSSNASPIWQYDVARQSDHKGQFLINCLTEDAVTSPITLVQNWSPPSN